MHPSCVASRKYPHLHPFDTFSTRLRRRRVVLAAAALLASPGALPSAAISATPPQNAAASARFEAPDAAVEQVLALADKRLALMGAVAAWKWQHHAPVTAPAREQAVIGHAGELAVPLGLRREAVERLFALQVMLARDEEARLEQRWMAHGYDYQGQPPDLQRVIRPQLDHLTGQMVQALYLAAPVLAEADFPNQYAARAAMVLHAQGWSASRRDQLLQTLHAINAPAGPALRRIRAAGVLRVGTTGDYPPFSLEAAGRLTGADIELAQRLAASLGVRPVFIRTRWSQLLPDLLAGRFDLALGGVSITPSRAQAAAFSEPYYSGGKTIIARCADAARFASLAALDRPGVQLIVNPGGTNQQFVQSHVHHATVRMFADNRSIFAEIVAHRADVMITDEVEVRLQVQRHPALCRAMRGTLTQEHKAILMPKDTALVSAVDHWLQTELASGLPQSLIRSTISAAGKGE
jgi:cyclohexadienyl dehydratase